MHTQKLRNTLLQVCVCVCVFSNKCSTSSVDCRRESLDAIWEEWSLVRRNQPLTTKSLSHSAVCNTWDEIDIIGVGVCWFHRARRHSPQISMAFHLPLLLHLLLLLLFNSLYLSLLLQWEGYDDNDMINTMIC